MSFEKDNLASAIRNLLETDVKIGNAFNTEDIKQLWSSYMPEEVLEYTQTIRYKSGKLTISISSAPLRQNLIFKSEEIKEALNEKIKTNRIERLVFI